jgi:hypothetical protein
MSPLLIIVSLMFAGLAIASAWNSLVNVSRDGIPLEAWKPGQFIITDENGKFIRTEPMQ